MVIKNADDIFRQANEHDRQGRFDAATALMCELVTGQGDPEVRSRAAALFDIYLAKEKGVVAAERNGSGREKKPAAPPLIGKGSAEDLLRMLRAKRETRLADNSIPKGDALPEPLADSIEEYVQDTVKDAVLPPEMRAAVDAVEAITKSWKHPRLTTQAKQLLERLWRALPEHALRAEVFAAALAIFYANGFLSPEQTRDLSFFIAGLREKKTIADLVEAGEEARE